MNSAFKEVTQGGCNAQDRFSAKFQAPHVRGTSNLPDRASEERAICQTTDNSLLTNRLFCKD